MTPWSAPTDENAVVTVEQQLRAEAVVQQLLAPFIAEQARLAEELGRERALRETAERERDTLKGQLAAQVQPFPPHRLWQRLRRTPGGQPPGTRSS